MTDRIVHRNYLEVDDTLLKAVRKTAVEQGRDEREVIAEALRRYLDTPADALIESFRRDREQRQEREFTDLLDRMSSRFDLDEDEAMNLATSEIRAMWEERRKAAVRERTKEQQSES